MLDRISLQTGAEPLKQEIATANFLVDYDKKVKIRFLAVSKTKNVKTPDIEMDGLKWEIKNPVGKGGNTIKRAFEVASNQSCNIIFDLRRSKMPDKVNLPKLEKEFNDIKKVKRLKVITKSRRLLDFEK
jgi:hypothetical protein